MEAPRISAITVYPIKSTAGISCSRATLTPLGLRYDRRFMIVDSNTGIFVTQRVHPELSQVRSAFSGERLRVVAPNMPSLELPLEPEAQGGLLRPVQIWEDTCPAQVMDREVNTWFSRFLGRSVTLVYMPKSTRRAVDPERARRSDDVVSFADGFPLLVISEASLEALNARLETPLPMARFRPNLVVAGAMEPHAEDTWARFRVGPITFFGVKPCSRCAITTIDPETAETGREPLATLAMYRKREGKVYFGQNLLHEGSGSIAVGDPVKIMERRPVP